MFKSFNCFPCNSGNEGVCRKTGAGYQIDCNICGEQGLTNTYAGETGKNLFNRGANHINDVEKKRTNSPLWKHIVEKHSGAMVVPIFAHFHMKLIQFWVGPWEIRRWRCSVEEAVSSGYPNPTRYPVFLSIPDPTRFSFRNHRVAGNPKHWVLPDVSGKPEVSGTTRYFGYDP